MIYHCNGYVKNYEKWKIKLLSLLRTQMSSTDELVDKFLRSIEESSTSSSTATNNNSGDVAIVAESSEAIRWKRLATIAAQKFLDLKVFF